MKRRSFLQRMGAGLAALGLVKCSPVPVVAAVPAASGMQPSMEWEEFRDRLIREAYGQDARLVGFSIVVPKKEVTR